MSRWSRSIAFPLAAAALALALGGCIGRPTAPGGSAFGATAASHALSAKARAAAVRRKWPCNDGQFLRDQLRFADGELRGDQEVDVCGSVRSVLPMANTRNGLQGYFYVQVSPEETVQVVVDLDRMDAPPWPWFSPGVYAYVRGRYYFDGGDAQGIDWTHRGRSSSWPTPGYFVINGIEYQ
ncbi:MAG: hypothetical protein WAJ85_01400 [Candidatus Baltobacteraceae bacterium]|jgi:hypothetical protein